MNTLLLLLAATPWMPFEAPFQPDPPSMTRVPDGTFHCLIVLPRPMTGKERPHETAQLAITDYPDPGDRLITRCEVVSEGH